MAFEYAPAPESRSVVDIASSYGLFINGEFVDATGGSTFKTVNPATEEVLAEISEAGSADVDRAVQAARSAYDRVWGADVRPRSREVPVPHRAPRAGTLARVGSA